MDELVEIINDLKKKVDEALSQFVVRKITIPADGFLVIKQLTSDPSTPVEGEIWFNTTSHTLKVRNNGATKTVTLV